MGTILISYCTKNEWGTINVIFINHIYPFCQAISLYRDPTGANIFKSTVEKMHDGNTTGANATSTKMEKKDLQMREDFKVCIGAQTMASTL